MRVLVQRVARAAVHIGGETVASIGHGLLLLVAFKVGDTDSDLTWMAGKIAHLRIFEDDAGKMNRSVLDVKGQALAVSQFTLFGDVRKGKRPSFDEAARPEQARELYEHFVERIGDFAGGTGPVEGQTRGEITHAFPVIHLAEFMEALYHTVVRQWTVDLTGPHKLTDRVDSAVEFFLRGVKP